MKRIDKQEAPPGFIRCINNKKHRPQNWDAFTKDHPRVKQELAGQLLQEQGFLCCYCEQRIDGDKSHIEHLQPQSTYQKLMFEYQNLLSCCDDKNSCGNKKGNWFSEFMVTPLNADCEERFHYQGNGTIIPADRNDRHAQETIDQLNLNSDKLKNMRMQIFEVYRYLKENAPDEEFVEYIRGTLYPNPNGEYAEFWTTIKYVAEKA